MYLGDNDDMRCLPLNLYTFNQLALVGSSLDSQILARIYYIPLSYTGLYVKIAACRCSLTDTPVASMSHSCTKTSTSTTKLTARATV